MIMLSAVGIIGLACVSLFSGVARPASQAPTRADTIIVTRRRPVDVPSASLRVELLSVTDSRCPRGVQCVWAGHAVVKLRITQRGGGVDTVAIGTPAPASRKLPGDTIVFGQRLHLVRLIPAPSVERAVSLARYRVTIEIGSQ